ncbi:Rieske (2Fe-2S) protein [Paracidovorax valerianellae]|uniref:Ferredoxin subunit of nitrite reductase or a ring-hydroxylating dioxygenase n=1 Tax=Paracidovorax valerianellae TaxID=187868 RepID=A0A1G6VN26_9BURK|nr:Rieske 2Fe-2S domain-containing protein [Paracidovorax valerianellae]MDA8447072.1 Rieske 2Fe-2S domain-containing protein [Paracidovorax valerianellae]SDD54793.1 Ferredoxin subunit of nitrite reductase or a ring-hydroxylating dioxygenase [Paracidovorax valerianellae]
MTFTSQPIDLCAVADLVDSGDAVAFDVVYAGQACRAFAVRFKGQPYAYLNRCTHVPMEMDYQPGRFFDDTGQWLLCATHGAAYRPDTGACAGGPCRGGLVKIELSESQDVVRWHTDHHLQPVEF